ncbi:hypothetical protein HJA95_24960 [Rhizobium binae]|uniref:hypothetical protein n=1 Tax=Rhizobium binae TaxID=1138190 RepID=UPI001C839985|nr:hypothetical protein [Rhizobium binae]MBX4952752.1 hypothetical protein [Rhizobium binae]
MAFEPIPFITAVINALRTHGFIQSAATIETQIGHGADNPVTGEAEELPPRRQCEIAAAVIEQHIVMPYRAWEEAVTIIALSTGTEADDTNADDLLVMRGERGLAPLGSFAYRNAIEGLAQIVGYLRGGPPPAPRGGGRGGPPGGPDSGGPSAPNVANTTRQIASNRQVQLSMHDVPVEQPQSMDYVAHPSSDDQNETTEQVATIRI